MTDYVITAENSIFNCGIGRNAMGVHGNDRLIVYEGGEIYTGEQGHYAVSAISTGAEIIVHGVVWSDGWEAINVWGSDNRILIGPTGLVQGHFSSDNVQWAAIKVYGSAYVSNYGRIIGKTGVNFHDIYEPEPGSAKTLENFGFISGSGKALVGGRGSDVIINHVGATLSGYVDLMGGDDVFWMGGKSSVVHLGWGDDTVGVLRGANTAHAIFGDGGNDLLTGGGGADVFHGGAGRDLFAFNNAMGSNPDKITDFESGQDKISLDRDKFANLTKGTVTNVAGRESQLVGPGLIYDYEGLLQYDSDGAGGALPFTIAYLAGRPTLLPSDIYVI